MDLPLVTVEPAEAKRQAGLYRALLRDPKRSHTPADEAAYKAYRALASDQSVVGLISIVAAFQRAGLDDLGRPRLGIARADAREVLMRRTWDGAVHFDEARLMQRRRTHPLVSSDGCAVNLPDGTFDRASWDAHKAAQRAWRGIVPTIPPDLRPAQLSGLHVLWEAEWFTAPQPPHDPALLRNLGGDLWAVLATWDLTEVERLALALAR